MKHFSCNLNPFVLQLKFNLKNMGDFERNESNSHFESETKHELHKQCAYKSFHKTNASIIKLLSYL